MSEYGKSDSDRITVKDIIEEVKNRICNDYCRYPDEYGRQGLTT